MRVLLAPDRFGDLTGVEAARALRAGWLERAPHVEVTSLPQSDGGPGFLRAVEAATGATLELLDLPDAPGTPLLTSRDGTAYVEAAEAIGDADTSAPLGVVLDRLRDAAARRVVIGVGGLRVLDGGRGLIDALGGHPAAARDRLRDLELVAAVDTDQVLLGLQGACAGAVRELGLTQEQAQAAEGRMGEWVDEVRRALPPPVDLLSGRPQRLDRHPGAGAGGGLGFGLAALGATLRPGPEVVAELTGLASAAHGAAVVVTATTSYDWTVLQHSVAEQVAHAAASCAAPAVLLADEIQVGRRETMSLGFAGAYGVLPAGRLRASGERRAAHEQEAALRALAGRVARTWTPHRD